MRHLALLACATMFASSCDLGEGPLRVKKVLVDVDAAAVAAGVDRELVREAVGATLRRARGLKLVEAEDPDSAATLRVVVESFAPGDAEDTPTTVALSIDVRGASEGSTADISYRGHSVTSVNGVVASRTLIEQAIRDALSQVLSTRGASELKTDELRSWLRSDAVTREQRRRAVRILGSRRDQAAAQPLADILLGDDEELAMHALTALTNIGAPESVDAVITFAEQKPPLIRKQVIEAVRAIGTHRGMAWLFTLSTGYPDEDIQAQAASALLQLEEGKAGTGDR